MNPNDYRSLIHEVLADDSVENFRRQSLAAGLTALRRRKRVKQFQRACLMVAVLLLPVWLLLPRASDQAQLSAIPSSPLVSFAPEQTPPAQSKIEEIGDAELLALFPGQTVALIGPPGDQRLLVFGNGRMPEGMDRSP